ncbi:MAG: energy coupling factor transporter S component ThiW [Ruminococcus sp.]|nr:energy coupling factor transporter S component ThiW [Ruminococcus sp.]
MNKTQIKKLCLAAMLVAIGVAASPVNFPIGASKCCPAQAFVNVLSGVLLGPWYAAGVGFCCALIRNLLGTGTLLAFPGSIFGAVLAGLVFHKVKKWLPLAAAGEVFGTAVLGGIVAFPVAKFIMNSESAALFGFVLPFFVSSAGGAVIGFILLEALDKSGVLKRASASLDGSTGNV